MHKFHRHMLPASQGITKITPQIMYVPTPSRRILQGTLTHRVIGSTVYKAARNPLENISKGYCPNLERLSKISFSLPICMRNTTRQE